MRITWLTLVALVFALSLLVVAAEGSAEQSICGESPDTALVATWKTEQGDFTMIRPGFWQAAGPHGYAFNPIHTEGTAVGQAVDEDLLAEELGLRLRKPATFDEVSAVVGYALTLLESCTASYVAYSTGRDDEGPPYTYSDVRVYVLPFKLGPNDNDIRKGTGNYRDRSYLVKK